MLDTVFRKQIPAPADSELDVPAAISDRGCERELNEDRYSIIDSALGTAWVICDGMGGAVGGDLAAQLAVDAIKRVLEQAHVGSPEQLIRLAIEEANRVIVLRRQNPVFSKMGTTVVAVMESNGEYVIAHAGDSRAYLLRGKSVEQLTIDHTYVQQLVDEGKISAMDALAHPQAHVLTRCLGATTQIKLDLTRLWCREAEVGEETDRILLCSDGLYSLVDDDEIAGIVAEYSPQESCARLTELAKDRGGCDNITVIIIPVAGCLSDEQTDEAFTPRKRAVVRKRSSSQVRGSKLRFLVFLGISFLSGTVTTCILILMKIFRSA